MQRMLFHSIDSSLPLPFCLCCNASAPWHLFYGIHTLINITHYGYTQTLAALICTICPTNIFPNEKSTHFRMVIYIEMEIYLYIGEYC